MSVFSLRHTPLLLSLMCVSALRNISTYDHFLFYLYLCRRKLYCSLAKCVCVCMCVCVCARVCVCECLFCVCLSFVIFISTLRKSQLKRKSVFSTVIASRKTFLVNTFKIHRTFVRSVLTNTEKKNCTRMGKSGALTHAHALLSISG